MAVTRIKNNQITDATSGNTFLGVNATSKLQDFTITSAKIANNLTYNSNLTVTGNLTVQGNTTTIDTTITTIEDPVILLASGQTTGTPVVDIGFVGARGNLANIAFVWNESADEFVTAFTSTGETNTTITISSYADFHTNNANIGGNIVVNGTTSLVGNIVGAVTFSGNLTAGNLLTPGLISATGVIDSQSVITGNILHANSGIIGTPIGVTTLYLGNVNPTTVYIGGDASNIYMGNVNSTTTVAGNLAVGAAISATGNVTGGNVSTGGLVTATGNVTGGNINTGGQVVATSNITGGNLLTGGLISATSNITGGNILFGSGIVTGTGNIYGGNIIAQDAFFGNIDLTGDITVNSLTSNTFVSATANVISGNVTTGGVVTATGNVTGGNLITGGAVTATGNVTGGNVTTAGEVTATGNVTGGNVNTGGLISATGNITGGNLLTPGLISAAGLATSGNIETAGYVSATGNVIANNVNTDNVVSTGAITISTGANGNINLSTNGTGNIVLSNTYINGLQLTPQQDGDATSKYYVDQLVTTAISYHEAVVAATTGNLNAATGGTVTYAQPNGAANGVGATLTTTGSFTTIDNANVQTAGTRILVKDQANAVQNGVYVWSNATVITRASTEDTYGAATANALSINDYFFVTSGNVNLGSAWIVDAPAGVITFGTSNILFAQFSQSQVYSANTSAGLVLVGQTFSAKVDNNTTAFDGGGNISVKAGANLTTPNIGAATGTSFSATGNIEGGNILTGGFVTATGNLAGGNITTAGVVTATGNVTGGNLITAGLITATGNVTGGNVNTAGLISATGNVTGGNLLTAGLVSATGIITSASNISGANVTTPGLITATGNITGGNILFGSGIVSGTGNIYANNIFANISGNIDAAGSNTQVQFNDGDLLGASAAFTFDKSTNVLALGGQITSTAAGNAATNGGQIFLNGATLNRIDWNTNGTGAPEYTTRSVGAKVVLYPSIGVSATDYALGVEAGALWSGIPGNDGGQFFKWYGGNVLVASLSGTGIFSATGNIAGANILTAGYVTATGNVTGGNVNTAGLITATGNIYGGNLILAGAALDTTAGRLTVNSTSADADFAVNGDTLANVFYIDAGTGTGSFGASTQVTNAIVNFATTTSIKVPAGNTAQRPGTGVTGMVRFNTTNNNLELYDNSEWTAVGVPVFTVIADEQFAGDGSTVQFTLTNGSQTTNSCIVSINGVVQIPTLAYAVSGAGGNILTFTEAPATTDVIDVREITTTTTVTQIVNTSGNAIIAVSDTTADVVMTGNVSPSANLTYSLGNSTNRWSNLWVGGNTIYLGNLQLKENPANTFVIYQADGITQANIDVGNVDVSAITSGTSTIGIYGTGQAYINVNSNANVLLVSNTSVLVNGVFSATGNVVATGNVTGGNITTAGMVTATGNVTGGNVNTAGVVTATGNVTGGNIRTAGLITATGNITGGNLVTAGNLTANGLTVNVDAVITGNLTVNGTTTTINSNTITTNDLQISVANNAVSGAAANNGGLEVGPLSAPFITWLYNNSANTWISSAGISAVGNISAGGNLSLGGNIVDTGPLTISTSSNGNITLAPNGTGVIVVNTDIRNGQANATGNIGSSTGYFNTVFAKATSAQYADLAEKYTADADYEPGTVVMFGGSAEVTLCVNDGCSRVAGVISTNPSYRMNDGLQSEHTAMVALTGRVPTSVTGTVRKGDMMVSAGNGVARAEANPAVGTVIGKALADSEGDAVIEVVVGRV